ncbi:hypothetical protein Q4555_14585 [Octadecabacter sp. 1_MG-2023]|uniref:hypothetical protein n=1 Tax=unclassified Octadecabacter TaxID=196158 RepID=UPI001C087661|nr:MULTISPECIES: hypothetical protein [unclassified Octadecabacter]MBU2991928.1 hypothetical protein [Octadecabacter sp. B2R22]MDO6735902.1 hypothetical protein [Octadecabacter sp. 1_MG-2023]
MPRSSKPRRKTAASAPVARSNRRATTPKQAKGPNDLGRRGRSGQTAARATKFPGRQGGR